MSVEERGQGEELLQDASPAELPPPESTEADATGAVAVESSDAAAESAAPAAAAEAEAAESSDAVAESAPPEPVAEAEAAALAEAAPETPGELPTAL